MTGDIYICLSFHCHKSSGRTTGASTFSDPAISAVDVDMGDTKYYTMDCGADSKYFYLDTATLRVKLIKILITISPCLYFNRFALSMLICIYSLIQQRISDQCRQTGRFKNVILLVLY